LSQSPTLEESIAFARQVLAAKPGEVVNVGHTFNYFNRKLRNFPKSQQIKKQSPEKIIYTNPGQARSLELYQKLQDYRAGNFPQHNSHGDFHTNLEVLPSISLEVYSDLHTVNNLLEYEFEEQQAVLTKKKIAKIGKQFANLSSECFMQMMCLHDVKDKRDFNVWVKRGPIGFFSDPNISHQNSQEGEEVVIAYINQARGLIQFIQTITRNIYGDIIDLKHIVYELGIPIVINQSTFDKFGNLRNIAHVGITGNAQNGFINSLERFDDGTVLWTSSEKDSQDIYLTGSAALKFDGEVVLVDGGDRRMSEFSARNLGAEGIHPRTLSWTGRYSPEGCLKEVDDKFIVRREYKSAVRKQVYQIVDGACIPGPEPIFNIF
jgi:hypothetical protein